MLRQLRDSRFGALARRAVDAQTDTARELMPWRRGAVRRWPSHCAGGVGAGPFWPAGGGLVAGAALSVGVDAQPVSATPLWTINYTGHGSSSSDATLTVTGACPSTDHTTIRSAFHWSVTWQHVVLSIPPLTGNITGGMLGMAYETETMKAPADCGGNKNCDKTVDFSADEGLSGSNPAALLFHKSANGAPDDVITVDLLTFSDQDAECGSQDPDDTGFLVDNPAQLSPSGTDPLAASDVIPVSELKHSGKIIIVVHKTAFNYPTPPDSDCSNADLGLKFYELTMFRDLAENAAISLAKGTRVVVVGNAELKHWTDEQGQERSSKGILVNAIGPDLRWAAVALQRPGRQKPTTTTEGMAGGDDEEPF